MRTLGAVDAINLDGGGSTTMTVGDQVVNQPSDSTGERPVGDALVLLPAQTDRPRLKAALATPAGNGRTRSMKPGTLARTGPGPAACRPRIPVVPLHGEQGVQVLLPSNALTGQPAVAPICGSYNSKATSR